MLVDKEEVKKHRLEGVIAISLYSLVVLFFSVYYGLFDCGFHFIDEHEIFTYTKAIEENGYWNTLLETMFGNFRLRYSLYPVRITAVYFFGTNFKYWHMFFAFLAIINMFLIYKVARKMKAPRWLAFLVPAFIYSGTQNNVLWLIGLQENIGIFYLMMTLLFLFRYEEKRSKVSLVFTIFFALCVGGIKESFLLVLPVIPLMGYYYTKYCLKKQKADIKEDIKSHLMENRVCYIIIALIFIINLCVILFAMDASYKNSALSSSVFSKEFLNYLWITFSYYLRLYVDVTLVGFIVLILPNIIDFRKDKNQLKDYLIRLTVPMLIALYGVASQIYLHKAVGMMTYRYLIPATIYITFFWFVYVYEINKEYCEEKKSLINNCFYIVFGFIAISYLTEDTALQGYISDGRDTTEFVTTVGEYLEEDSKVISMLEYEYDYAMAAFLENGYGIGDVYNLYVGEHPEGYADDDYSPVEGKELLAIEDADAYLCYEETMEELLKEYDIDLSGFERIQIGRYIMYVK